MNNVTEKPRTAVKILTSALIGGVIGAAAGILYAPRSGKLTRAMIQEKGMEFSTNLKNKLKRK